MRLHLRYKNIHRTVVRATSELFDSRPWSGTAEEQASKFEKWLRRSSDAYGLPAPTLEVSEDARGTSYDLGQITLTKYSVIELFRAFRYHMMAMGVAQVEASDETSMRGLAAATELDAVSWACSLYYKIRPVLFRKNVRSGKIRYVTPRDLLTTEAQAAYDEEQAAAFNARMEAALGSSLDEFPDEDDSYDDPDEHDDLTLTHSAADIGPVIEVDGEPTLVLTAPEDRVTTQEAAVILGVSTSRVLQITERIGGVREGRRWSFSRQACEQYLASR